MKQHIILFTMIYSLTLTNPSHANAEQSVKIIDLATQAHFSRNASKLTELELGKQLTAYEHAYIDYRQALYYMQNRDNKNAEQQLNQAEQYLVNKGDDRTSKDYSLQASVYSLKAGLGIFNGAVYGSKSSAAIDKAKQLNPNNPQVWLVKGLSAFHTPGIFGGSNKQALKHFDKAIEMYEQNSNKSAYWGYEEALVWRALVHKKNSNSKLCLRDLNQALASAPEFVWASELLARFTAGE